MRSSPFALVDRLLAPAPPPDRVAFLTRQPYAHRGLHGGGRVENSLAAFSAAAVAGHGIELDVRASRDGEAFVYHDGILDRLTDHTGRLADRSARQLDQVRLTGADETLPTLHAALTRILGRVPVLVEIKSDGGPGPLCLAVRRALEGYRGPVAVISFDPDAIGWFRRHAPKVVRGLSIRESDTPGWRGRLRRHLALWRARPDFLTCNVADLPSRFAAAARARGLPVIAWTVTDAATERVALAHADEMIFERVAA